VQKPSKTHTHVPCMLNTVLCGSVSQHACTIDVMTLHELHISYLGKVDWSWSGRRIGVGHVSRAMTSLPGRNLQHINDSCEPGRPFLMNKNAMHPLTSYCCCCSQCSLSASESSCLEMSLDLSFTTLGQRIGKISYCERPPLHAVNCKVGVTPFSMIALSDGASPMRCANKLLLSSFWS
jgi:hypothetical protein